MHIKCTILQYLHIGNKIKISNKTENHLCVLMNRNGKEQKSIFFVLSINKSFDEMKCGNLQTERVRQLTPYHLRMR